MCLLSILFGKKDNDDDSSWIDEIEEYEAIFEDEEE